MERDIVMTGVKIGEHSANHNDVISEIRERVIGSGSNFVYIRPKFDVQVPHEYFIEWARFLAANKIYFHFGYTAQRPPKGKESQFIPEVVDEMKKIAGEFFLGECISEIDCSRGGKFAGYFSQYVPYGPDVAKQETGFENLKDAHESYVEYVRRFAEIDRKVGLPHVLSMAASAFTRYNMEAGADIPILETVNYDWDSMYPSVRGAARALGSGMWGTLIAHEWFAGMRHDDILKQKRLELMWKFAYMSGANIISIESGDEAVESYGHSYAADSELCEMYRSAIRNMASLAKQDERPVGGPKVKFAFVSGLHDAWSGFVGTSLWNQFEREEWGYGPAEHSWRLMEEIGTKRKWTEVTNYGGNDLSAYPAYGTFDIIPIEAPIEKLSEYEYLAFLGWNSMTEENADKLAEFVRRGGKLLMSAAHLNCNTARDGKFIPISEEKIAKLFGCRMTGKTLRTNGGTKFEYISSNEEMLYPGTKSFVCDPNFSGGFTEYLEVELCGAKPLGYLSESFIEAPGKLHPDFCTVIENKIGKGVATLVTSLDYPGHPAALPLYKMLLREMISSSSRNCDIKVIGSDRIRYTVYEEDKIYLLNTDYDMPVMVSVIKDNVEKRVTLESLELKILEL